MNCLEGLGKLNLEDKLELLELVLSNAVEFEIIRDPRLNNTAQYNIHHNNNIHPNKLF